MAYYIAKYEVMHERFEKGEITPEQWAQFCVMVLENLMIENRQVLENLKYA